MLVAGHWLRMVGGPPIVGRFMTDLVGGDGALRLSNGGHRQGGDTSLEIRCSDPATWERFGEAFQSECQALAREMRDRDKSRKAI